MPKMGPAGRDTLQKKAITVLDSGPCLKLVNAITKTIELPKSTRQSYIGRKTNNHNCNIEDKEDEHKHTNLMISNVSGLVLSVHIPIHKRATESKHINH